jgi:hypothetical protein
LFLERMNADIEVLSVERARGSDDVDPVICLQWTGARHGANPNRTGRRRDVKNVGKPPGGVPPVTNPWRRFEVVGPRMFMG